MLYEVITPLTVIDPHMKWELRTQLKRLHREFGHTMIYVTHDQTEALTFADKVVVMYDGRVEEQAHPLFIATPAGDMNQDDLITADLTRAVNFGAPSYNFV